MKILNYLSLLCIVSFNFLYGSELEKFYAKYALPQEITSTLDFNDQQEIFFKYYEPFVKYPQYFLKDEQIGRIINAERMRCCIAAYGLTCFDVPQKYIYKNDYKIRVLANTVNPAFIDEITLKEAQQLIKLIEITGYHDLHTRNIMRDRHTEKLVIIDTENNAFVNKKEIVFLYEKDQDIEEIFARFRMDMVDFMNKETRRFVDKYLSRANKEEHQQVIENFVPVPLNAQYDAQLGIDFEQVKREFKATRK